MVRVCACLPMAHMIANEAVVCQWCACLSGRTSHYSHFSTLAGLVREELKACHAMVSMAIPALIRTARTNIAGLREAR